MDFVAGRRVLVACVTGEPGARIQAWRERYDPKQAVRLPPHLTLCYRPPVDVSLELLEAQVRHGFPAPIQVRLGAVFELPHPEAPLAVSVHQVSALEAARRRLFDGTHAVMGGRTEWPWHITCVRYGRGRDREALLARAAQELALDEPWTITRVSYLELQNGRYAPLAEWQLS
jgi:hypothetical protein